jgi:hypothetical protein
LSSPLSIGAYALVALLGAFELGVLWLAGHPDVPPDYRAYYIAQTTTCLNQPVSGAYGGGVISFLPDGGEAARPIKVCGWEGPVGDGTHAVGTSARLRFALNDSVPDPVLAIEMLAVRKDERGSQRVAVLVNGKPIGEVTVGADRPQRFDIPLGVASADPSTYDVTFEFPDALQMGPTDPQTRWRSIKLSAAGIIERSPSGA